MSSLLQVAGAVTVLVAYIAVQLGRTQPRSWTSLSLNLAGSALLALLAAGDRQWGFLLLEGSWALMSAWGLVAGRRRATSPRAGTVGPDGTTAGLDRADARDAHRRARPR
jgi:hypothetical protein